MIDEKDYRCRECGEGGGGVPGGVALPSSRLLHRHSSDYSDHTLAVELLFAKHSAKNCKCTGDF